MPPQMLHPFLGQAIPFHAPAYPDTNKSLQNISRPGATPHVRQPWFEEAMTDSISPSQDFVKCNRQEANRENITRRIIGALEKAQPLGGVLLDLPA